MNPLSKVNSKEANSKLRMPRFIKATFCKIEENFILNFEIDFLQLLIHKRAHQAVLVLIYTTRKIEDRMNTHKRPKVSIYIAASIDGFIARKDGRLDWLDRLHIPDEDFGYRTFSIRLMH